jgi:hypothetical protein
VRYVYVVMGQTGEYSDMREWPVKAFLDLARAEELVVNALNRAKEIEEERPSEYHVAEGINEFDPEMKMDYTGTNYYIMDVRLEE